MSNPDQYILDFESSGNDQRAWLAGALDAVGATKLRRLAELVYQHERDHDGRPLEAPLEEVASALDVHRTTAKRRIASLLRLGIFRQIIRPGETSRLGINWQRVRSIACGRGGDRRPPPATTGEVSRRSDQVGPGRTRSDQVGPGGFVLTPKQTSHLPPSQTLATVDAPLVVRERPRVVDLEAGGWREAGRFLLERLGVGLAAAAIGEFRARGGTLDQLQAILEYVLAHGGGTDAAAFGPGAICNRLRRHEPGLAVDVGWPPASAAWQRHQARRERSAAIDRQIARRGANRGQLQTLAEGGFRFADTFESLTREPRR